MMASRQLPERVKTVYDRVKDQLENKKLTEHVYSAGDASDVLGSPTKLFGFSERNKRGFRDMETELTPAKRLEEIDTAFQGMLERLLVMKPSYMRKYLDHAISDAGADPVAYAEAAENLEFKNLKFGPSMFPTDLQRFLRTGSCTSTQHDACLEEIKDLAESTVDAAKAAFTHDKLALLVIWTAKRLDGVEEPMMVAAMSGKPQTSTAETDREISFVLVNNRLEQEQPKAFDSLVIKFFVRFLIQCLYFEECISNKYPPKGRMISMHMQNLCLFAPIPLLHFIDDRSKFVQHFGKTEDSDAGHSSVSCRCQALAKSTYELSYVLLTQLAAVDMINSECNRFQCEMGALQAKVPTQSWGQQTRQFRDREQQKASKKAKIDRKTEDRKGDVMCRLPPTQPRAPDPDTAIKSLADIEDGIYQVQRRPAEDVALSPVPGFAEKKRRLEDQSGTAAYDSSRVTPIQETHSRDVTSQKTIELLRRKAPLFDSSGVDVDKIVSPSRSQDKAEQDLSDLEGEEFNFKSASMRERKSTKVYHSSDNSEVSSLRKAAEPASAVEEGRANQTNGWLTSREGPTSVIEVTSDESVNQETMDHTELDEVPAVSVLSSQRALPLVVGPHVSPTGRESPNSTKSSTSPKRPKSPKSSPSKSPEKVETPRSPRSPPSSASSPALKSQSDLSESQILDYVLVSDSEGYEHSDRE